ncbi:Transcriptional regulator, MucR family [Mycoavidus cysteinexigens]|uniref:Transcriptional regulator, MucR family n=1 Tax=Mycoavidus cysteinexigens TaxID=1553431 RepID=A0A2Z6EV20_9BURK|nr:Transcriptional regulator, MucR family [Mycoavidus cysteinexigens]GLR02032.1 hypothetical protein GCM10007934_18460 [Mycoavidus cysteinexigens]
MPKKHENETDPFKYSFGLTSLFSMISAQMSQMMSQLNQFSYQYQASFAQPAYQQPPTSQPGMMPCAGVPHAARAA